MYRVEGPHLKMETRSSSFQLKSIEENFGEKLFVSEVSLNFPVLSSQLHYIFDKSERLRCYISLSHHRRSKTFQIFFVFVKKIQTDFVSKYCSAIAALI